MQLPDWFQSYISQPAFDHFINVSGTSIHYKTWNKSNKPGLLFVHGHAAHCRWWDFIAPAFVENYSVGAIDLSGNGDSEHKQQYTAPGFANEILAVANCLGESTFLVGHSFGGSMARVAAYLHRKIFAGLILVDSVIPALKGNRKTPVMPRLKSHFYPNLQSGMKRFRLRPPQPCQNQFLLDYVAAHSLRQTDQGFAFKVDQAVFAKTVEDPNISLPDGVTMIRSIDCPTAFIYGEQSRFFTADTRTFLTSLFEPGRLKQITAAHHHVFLDQPLAFIDALGVLLRSLSGTKPI